MYKRKQTIAYVLTDFLAAAATWLLFNLLRYEEVAKYNFGSLYDYLRYYQVLQGQILIPFFWLALYFFSGYYNKPFGKSRIGEVFSTFASATIGSVMIFFIVVLNDLPESFQIYYKLFFALYATQFAITYIGRLAITRRAMKKLRNREWMENVIVIGTGANALKTSGNLYDLGYNVAGFVSESDPPRATAPPGGRILGTMADLAGIIEKEHIDQIVVATEKEDVQLLYSLYRYKLPVKVLAEKNNILSKVKVKAIHGIPLIDITENNFSEAGKNIKWFMDKALSVCVLAILSPLYAYIAIRVKAGSPGPVFFKQERIGYRGKPFVIYKFRTMYDDASKQGPLLTAHDDKRVTPFGRFLRKYRLDETPQFWNVLKGDMSIVGPRPEQKYYIDRIVQKAPYYYLLHNVRPGITSWGMVKYGYAETVEKMIDRLDYDILYYENMSIALDITILIYTIKIVFTGKGV